MTQANLFSGQELKRAGMDRAAENHAPDLDAAKDYAYFLGLSGDMTIDTLRDFYRVNGFAWNLGNSAGSVFSGKEWECVGFTPTTHPQGHGRIVRKWRLRK